MNNHDALKRQYNELLTREKKAELYIDDPARTPAEIERWTPEFNRILAELNEILSRIGQFTAAEVVHGFEFGEIQDLQNKNLQNMDLIFKRSGTNG